MKVTLKSAAYLLKNYQGAGDAKDKVTVEMLEFAGKQVTISHISPEGYEKPLRRAFRISDDAGKARFRLWMLSPKDRARALKLLPVEIELPQPIGCQTSAEVCVEGVKVGEHYVTEETLSTLLKASKKYRSAAK